MKSSTLFLILLTLTRLPLIAQEPRGVVKNAAPVPATGKTWALVVGISAYTYVDKLNYAHRDAEAFYQYLLSPAGGSVPQANISFLPNEKATTAQIIKALDNLLALVNPGDQVILYFAGHGDSESKTRYKRGYLLTYDTNSGLYPSSALLIGTFQDYVSTLSMDKKASVTVFLDACHAGKLVGNAYDGVQVTGQELTLQAANETKVMACQAGELSVEGKQWDNGHGAFTYHLIRGLQGLADTKPNGDGDGRVTLRELERYLEDHVSPEAMPVKQTPFKVGDASKVLAMVDIPTLTALKNNQPLATFAPVAGRGFVDDVLAKADSKTVALYGLFQKSLGGKSDSQLIQYYEQLMQQPDIAQARPFISRDLAAALIDDGQTFLNNYLNSKDQAGLSQETYQRLSDQLAYAAKILGSGSAFYKPMLARSAFFAGLKAKFAKDSTGAFRAFREAIRLDSTAAFVYNEQGFYLQELKRLADAESAYRKGLHFAPNWDYLYNNLGNLLKELKRFGESESAYRKAIEYKPDHAYAYTNLGALLYELKRFGEAESAYRKAIALQPDLALAYTNLGVLLDDLKRFGEAESAYRKAIEYKIDAADAYTNLGNLLYELKRFGEAEVAHRKAIEYKPDYADAYTNLGVLLKELKRFGEAESVYRKAIALKPDLARAHYNLGVLLKELKRFGEAESAYRKAIEYKVDDADAYGNLGVLLFEQKNYKDAASQFKYYTELQPQNINGWNGWGLCSLYLKDFATAKVCFNKVAQLAPTDTSAPYNLACLYSLQNNPKEALSWLEKALQRGFAEFAHIAEDTDLDNIRQMEEFKGLIKKYQK